MPKVVIVFNPLAARNGLVEKEILGPAEKLVRGAGMDLELFEIVPRRGMEGNARKLAERLRGKVLVVAAGGDGTVAVAVNAIMQAQERTEQIFDEADSAALPEQVPGEVPERAELAQAAGDAAAGEKLELSLAVIGYGTFDDTARGLGVRRPVEYGDEYIGGLAEVLEKSAAGKMQEVYPLEVRVDGEHLRYALNYVTVGMLAASMEALEAEKVRRKMIRRRTRAGAARKALGSLAKWYFGNREERHLQPGRLNGVGIPEGMTDYLAVNAPRAAGMLRSRGYYGEREEFGQMTVGLGPRRRMVGFVMRGMTVGLKLGRGKVGEIEFAEQVEEVSLQSEGERVVVRQVRKIEIRKRGVLKVVR